MTKTFRVTFIEWQEFEVFIPARTADDAVLIAETLRHSIGTVSPIVERDGGTDAFETSRAPASQPLTREAVARLRAVLPVMQQSAGSSGNAEDARAVRLLRIALGGTKHGVATGKPRPLKSRGGRS